MLIFPKKNKMPIQRPFNFQKWIDDNRHLLKPPVGNQQIYFDNKEFIVMVVGGPNARKDFHYNEGEEFFYQLEGDMVLRIVEDGKPVDIPIKEGEIFLLPGKVPHSPQRPAGTVGLVIERYRKPEEDDGFLWYCEKCGSKLYEEYFKMTDIVLQLPIAMKNFYDSQEHRTCKSCGYEMEKP
jgi:3-hydroxyanthranilate 3,4-dioxygenase